MSASHRITIQGISFPIRARYTEGHQCTAAEAQTLNQALGENLRNNFAKTVKDKLAAGVSHDELQAQFAEYQEAYTFHGYRRGGRPPADPAIKEAKKLAKLKIVEQCRLKGIDPKTFDNGKMDGLVESLMAKDPAYLREAKRRLEAARSVAMESIGDLLGSAE